MKTTVQIDWREWRDWRNAGRYGAIGKLNELLKPHGVRIEVLNLPEDYLELAASTLPDAQGGWSDCCKVCGFKTRLIEAKTGFFEAEGEFKIRF
jgi:hypothetical protein